MKFLVTSDIHFETLDIMSVTDYINHMKSTLIDTKANALIFAGDTVDSRYLMIESRAYTALTYFLSEISKICIDNNITFIILKGTPSHDGEVIANVINSHKINCTYIEYTQLKMIYNKKFLFIPELYYPKYEDFQRDMTNIMKDKPDVIIFHGMFDFAIPALVQTDSVYGQSRTVIMQSEWFVDKVKYLSIGGHVHSFINYKNIYYTGRFCNSIGKEMHKEEDYGLKLVELFDNDYKITPIINPDLIRMTSVTYDLTDPDNVNLDYIISNAQEYDLQRTVFTLLFSEHPASKGMIVKFRQIIKPLYSRKSLNYKKTKNQLSPSKINSLNEINEIVDIPTMLEELYNKAYKKDIPKHIMEEIVGDSHE